MLDQLFNPKSIAVVGATPKEGKVGNALLKNLIAFQKQEQEKGRGKDRHKDSVRISAVNPKYEEILAPTASP